MKKVPLRAVAIAVAILCVAATAEGYLKYKIEGESVLASPNGRALIRMSSEAKPEIDGGGLGQKGCPSLQPGVGGTALLLPAVQLKAAYDTRASFSLNFEEIRAGKRVRPTRIRARGLMTCGIGTPTKDPDYPGAIERRCTGTHTIASNSGRLRIEGTVGHEMTAFFIDDIIIGVKATELIFDMACTRR